MRALPCRAVQPKLLAPPRLTDTPLPRRNPRRCAVLAACCSHACDVTALGAGATLAADLAGVPIDVLIYNAGVNPDDGDEDGNQSFVMNTNAIAPFLIVTPVRDRPRFINLLVCNTLLLCRSRYHHWLLKHTTHCVYRHWCWVLVLKSCLRTSAPRSSRPWPS